MNMNLVIDIGNTRSKFFLFAEKEGQMLAHKVADGSSLRELEEFTMNEIQSSEDKITGAIVSSTVDISSEARSRLDALPYPVLYFTPDIPIPIGNQYATPNTLGTDRLAAAIGAWSQQEGHPLLVIDAGSCITIDFVSAQGSYMGGNISPGLHMRLQSMYEHAAHLPMVDAEGDLPDVGYNTETAIRAGAILGIRHEIEGYIKAFRRKYPDLLVFLTGGDAKRLAITQTSRTFADDFLVPKGLNAILEHVITMNQD